LEETKRNFSIKVHKTVNLKGKKHEISSKEKDEKHVDCSNNTLFIQEETVLKVYPVRFQSLRVTLQRKKPS
jgi:hypothetical protein